MAKFCKHWTSYRSYLKILSWTLTSHFRYFNWQIFFETHKNKWKQNDARLLGISFRESLSLCFPKSSSFLLKCKTDWMRKNDEMRKKSVEVKWCSTVVGVCLPSNSTCHLRSENRSNFRHHWILKIFYRFPSFNEFLLLRAGGRSLSTIVDPSSLFRKAFMGRNLYLI